VKTAVEELGIPHRVVQDNVIEILKSYGTRYWSTAVLVDRRGVVQYYHICEGAYPEFEAVIQRLLAEEKWPGARGTSVRYTGRGTNSHP